MTYSIHGSHADNLIPQYAVGGEHDDTPGTTLLLSDLGNMHALVIEGDEAQLRAWHKRVGEVLDEAFPEQPTGVMTVEAAIEQVQALLHEKYLAVGGDPRTRVRIVTWGEGSWGLRVAEVNYWLADETDPRLGSGSTFMQSDVPTGLAVCAQVERLLISHLFMPDEVDIERERLLLVLDANDGYDVQGLKDLAYGKVDEGIPALDLDEDVQDAANGLASYVNDAGIDEQVDFLVERLGYFAANTLIHDRNRQQR